MCVGAPFADMTPGPVDPDSGKCFYVTGKRRGKTSFWWVVLALAVFPLL